MTVSSLSGRAMSRSCGSGFGLLGPPSSLTGQKHTSSAACQGAQGLGVGVALGSSSVPGFVRVLSNLQAGDVDFSVALQELGRHTFDESSGPVLVEQHHALSGRRGQYVAGGGFDRAGPGRVIPKMFADTRFFWWNGFQRERKDRASESVATWWSDQARYPRQGRYL
ncbi:hypothetical protein MA5S0422_5512 [Mycobacteroides abscessus 5S-0422]|uniref:Uncharacterized protein n=1 Tax=Mycobacteroides abscessus subsp. massiliense TaxID=1962118 RepID=A0A1U1B541_9MYCO|nr:hypothetical protein MA5S0422_5512 [Mycobacteroides abscessus 5S-0422]CPU55382.1 Uncharacterised protein [Mycobacteroides abscessus]SIG93785.1 Uncharacterised protein [Mycobacteroides abscessus subsp. abscessus]SKM47965.1 Uncharacterised protein [Mycobacteroides abscessus subsp. massiliense]CPX52291.1 Uncharacterised protein [Mycobacteroides abscessus]